MLDLTSRSSLQSSACRIVTEISMWLECRFCWLKAARKAEKLVRASLDFFNSKETVAHLCDHSKSSRAVHVHVQMHRCICKYVEGMIRRQRCRREFVATGFLAGSGRLRAFNYIPEECGGG